MFRSLVLNGDFTPKVALREVMAKHPTMGVGAVAEARGEITIYDGKPIVSYGKEGSHPAVEAELAALLTVGTVAGWQSVIIERDVAPNDIEAFLAQMATTHGLKPDASFPFQIQGTLASYVATWLRPMVRMGWVNQSLSAKRPRAIVLLAWSQGFSYRLTLSGS
jgi:hypothetical protein